MARGIRISTLVATSIAAVALVAAPNALAKPPATFNPTVEAQNFLITLRRVRGCGHVA